MNNFKKIKKVLDFVWDNPYSSFYKDKYTKAGINLLKDINSLEDFKKLPYLTKDEIVVSDPFERFFLPWDKFGTVGISSGTTTNSNSLSVVFRSEDQGDFYSKAINAKPGLQFKSVMRILSPMQGGRSLVEACLVNKKRRTKVIQSLGDIYNLPLSAKIAAKLKVEFIITTPTILYSFLPFLKKEYELNNIKRVTLLGEYCSTQKASLFKRSFQNAKFVYNYGVSEGQRGIIGQYCPHLDSLISKYFHPADDYYLELLDCESGEELVITDLVRNGFPLIRYRTGDAVKVEDFGCECGGKQRMKMLGRINYDAVRVHGTFVYAHLMEKALACFLRYLSSPDWQLHIFEKSVRGKIMPELKLQVILKNDFRQKTAETRSIISKGVSERLYLSTKRTLLDLIKEGIFLPLEVEFVSSFPKSRKHRFIISHFN